MFGIGKDATPYLEPKHLYEKREARDKARLKAYNHILNQIHNRIFHTAQLSGNVNSIVYNVPPFVIGLPTIDLKDCIVYIVHMLRQSGFIVRYTYPTLLYISWNHYETEYNKQKNPIIQAMTPPPTSTSKKGKEGKRGVAQPSVSFALEQPPPRAPRSISDYAPPDSFIQGITRPAPKPIGNGMPTPTPTTNNVLADLWKFV